MSRRDHNSYKRVYLYGHSLGLARGAWHGSHAVSWEDTYTRLLFDRCRKLEAEKGIRIDYFPNNKRSRIIREIEVEMFFQVLFEPDVMIFDIGIGDCSPRVFSERQRAFVGAIRPRFLQRALLNFVGRHRRRIITMFPNKLYSTREQFVNRASNIAKACVEAGIHFGFISICPPGSTMAHRSPGLAENVVTYNRILSEVCDEYGGSFINLYPKLIDPSPDEYVLDDGHHLDVKGHLIYADGIEEWLRKVL